ncbi:hypothetical protein [Paenibacillus sp. FJAT-27812]|uniref:hypothetical protein n=1 Tax=Paenibacillus sp. FJAT-27812 TaxID=1684143 RepID=UPI0006A7E2C2|nr:hypothetical protein [Paenibacillus sp. FJAT-27812]
MLIRSYSYILNLRGNYEQYSGLTEHLEGERVALFGEVAEDGNDHDTLEPQQHTHMGILEEGDIDLKPVGLLGGLCDQWLDLWSFST